MRYSYRLACVFFTNYDDNRELVGLSFQFTFPFFISITDGVITLKDVLVSVLQLRRKRLGYMCDSSNDLDFLNNIAFYKRTYKHWQVEPA